MDIAGLHDPGDGSARVPEPLEQALLDAAIIRFPPVPFITLLLVPVIYAIFVRDLSS